MSNYFNVCKFKLLQRKIFVNEAICSKHPIYPKWCSEKGLDNGGDGMKLGINGIWQC